MRVEEWRDGKMVRAYDDGRPEPAVSPDERVVQEFLDNALPTALDTTNALKALIRLRGAHR